MNLLDKQYQNLLNYLISGEGEEKKDRTGTGTLSMFGYQIRHNMKRGFPLLTTKKMAWKSIVTELLWFLRGDTNIKYLVDNGCHIWDGDAYKNYLKKHPKGYYTNQHELDGLIFEGPSIWKDEEPLSQEEFINKIKTNDEFARTWGELGPIYGKQWRSWTEQSFTDILNRKVSYYGNTQAANEMAYEEHQNSKIDQIANLISELKTNPDSRRLMVNAWNVGELDQMVLPPCHYGFQVYTRELSLEERVTIFNEKKEKGEIVVPEFESVGDMNAWTNKLLDSTIPTRAISLMWNQRSVDTFLGLPFNIASYGLLLEIIAREVNMVPDELIGNLGDVHLYSNHIEQAKEQIGREPFDLPTVTITERNWYQHEKVKEHLGEKTFIQKIESYRFEDFTLNNYQSHPKIKAPLSN
jgi:thymidylate synthase